MGVPIWESKGADFSNSSATPSFAVPAGTAAGKLVIVSFFINVAATTVIDIPPNFASFVGTPAVGGSNSLVKYWKRLTSEDTDPYVFTLSANQYVEGASELYDNVVSNGDPIDSNLDFAFSDANGTVTPEVNINTSGPDRLIVHTATNWSGGTWTPPTDYTKRLQPPVGLVTTADKSQALEGATGSVTASATGNDKRIAHIAAIIGTTVEDPPPIVPPSESRTGGWYDLIWITRYPTMGK